MADLISIGIDPQEVFPHLSKAPITEAVIEIRANTETEWAEELITPRLKGEIIEQSQRRARTGVVPGVAISGRP